MFGNEQGTRRIDKIGGTCLYIRVLYQFLFNIIGFTVCEQEYMNKSPPP